MPIFSRYKPVEIRTDPPNNIIDESASNFVEISLYVNKLPKDEGFIINIIYMYRAQTGCNLLFNVVHVSQLGQLDINSFKFKIILSA